MTGGPWERRGVLRGLADLGFREMVTPRLIGWLYVAAAGFVALGTVAALLLVWSLSNWMGPGWWWFAPVMIAAGVAGVLVVRIACEWVLMAFTRGRRIEPSTWEQASPRPVGLPPAPERRRESA